MLAARRPFSQLISLALVMLAALFGWALSAFGQDVRPVLGFVPAHERFAGTHFTRQSVPMPGAPREMMGEGQVIVEGDAYYPMDGDYPTDAEQWHGDSSEPVWAGDDLGDSCCGQFGCAGGSCADCCAPPRLRFKNLAIHAGVFGATGPRNFAGPTPGSRVGTASFGFMEGANWGAPVPCFSEVGMQLGVNAAQSNLSDAQFALERRRQVFLTGGLFRRVDCGLQLGLAFDYLHDDWYSTLNLAQLRGEASWVFPGSHELGFWFATNMNQSTAPSVTRIDGVVNVLNETWQATDLYAFFYRYRAPCTGGNGRLYAGFTGDSEGLIGADLEIPVSSTLALRTGFAYLVPNDTVGTIGAQEERWNVGINIVWRPCGNRGGGCDSYYNPLLNVADNGSFMLSRR